MKMPASVVLLAPTDMSDASAPAVEYATDLARRLGGLLVLFHVISPKELDQGVAEGKFADRQAEEMCGQLTSWFQRAVPLADREGVRVQMAAGFGRPDEQILNRAAALQAGMIIMATHGRTGLQRAVFGSVTEAVLRHATCPVLTIRATAMVDAKEFPVGKWSAHDPAETARPSR